MKLRSVGNFLFGCTHPILFVIASIYLSKLYNMFPRTMFFVTATVLCSLMGYAYMKIKE